MCNVVSDTLINPSHLQYIYTLISTDFYSDFTIIIKKFFDLFKLLTVYTIQKVFCNVDST